MAVLGKLKCADILISRGISVNPMCSFCRGSLESRQRLFFDCDSSFLVLIGLLPAFGSFLLLTAQGEHLASI
ncbi:hypothetical protein KFK09_018289 [Dendrobium nobile]|uniref:Reverse transcriptase zinc-binding domain-containing protein n=1 Tax=Dendrobium nobile TaxID=94219 RepID=A0A8T3AVF5_DENNO|nr:hypothetical protein KFK09_018289 [Dendrobium nobile]